MSPERVQSGRGVSTGTTVGVRGTAASGTATSAAAAAATGAYRTRERDGEGGRGGTGDENGGDDGRLSGARARQDATEASVAAREEGRGMAAAMATTAVRHE